MLAKRQIRTLAAAALATIPNTVLKSPGDWATVPGSVPEIKLRSPGARKQSKLRGMPEFDTTVALEIEFRLQAETGEEAQDQIEALGAQVEDTLLTWFDFIKIIQQVSSIDEITEITADGSQHIAATRMTFQCETFEAFDPTTSGAYDALTSMGIHIDAANVFDASGTYTGAPFPGSVVPAPRESGPDGRDEGALDINLPQ